MSASATDDRFGRFLALSAVLVAKPNLPEDVGRAFYALLLEGADGPSGPEGAAWHYTRQDVRTALDRFGRLTRTPATPDDLERQVRETFFADAGSAAVAKTIAYIWYSAALPAQGGFPLKMAPAETYAAALVWEAISGTPTGVTGPYHGNWSVPPPRTIEGGGRGEGVIR